MLKNISIIVNNSVKSSPCTVEVTVFTKAINFKLFNLFQHHAVSDGFFSINPTVVTMEINLN